jgi:DNA-binding response OmpR family regulator
MSEPTPRARILVVDDDADTRFLLRMMLAGDGFEVSLAGDGEQAWTSLQASVPDLLLTDLMMPELDGIGLVQRVRADPALASLPVILLSAKSGICEQADAITLGADDYLIKPVQKADLLERIRMKMTAARPGMEAAEAPKAARRKNPSSAFA